MAGQEVVVGDLLVVRAGELVAADGILLAATELQVEESSLTGAPYPARKSALTDFPKPSEAPPARSAG